MQQGMLYKIPKTICRKGKPSPDIPVTNKGENVITSGKEQALRWTEHFEDSAGKKDYIDQIFILRNITELCNG